MSYRYHLGTTLYRVGTRPKVKAELAVTPKSEDDPKIRELLVRS